MFNKNKKPRSYPWTRVSRNSNVEIESYTYKNIIHDSCMPNGYLPKILIYIIIICITAVCSHDPVKRLRSMIDAGEFDQANQLLSSELSVSPDNPHLLFSKLELLIKAHPDNYLQDSILYAENQLKNHGVPILGIIRQTMLFDKNMVFKFHLARVINSLESLSGNIRNAFETIMIHSLEAEQPYIRIKAIEEVGRFQRKDATGLILLLNNSLKDSLSVEAALTAARVMAEKWQCDNGYRIAAKAVKDSTSPDYIRVMAMAALGYMHDKRAMKMVVEYKNDRIMTSNTLKDSVLRSKEYNLVYPSLHNIFNDKQTIDAHTVKSISNRFFDPELLGMSLETADPSIPVKTYVTWFDSSQNIDFNWLLVNALGKKRDPVIVPFLIRQMAGITPKIQHMAIIALGNIGQPALEPVIDSLNTENPLIRRNAITFLTLTRSKAASQAIFKHFMNGDTDMVLFTADALCGIRDSSLVDSLIGILDVPDNVMSLQAIRILGETGDKRAIPALEKITEPREKLFQAQSAIKKISRANTAN